jgi:hypothetical protein
VNWRDEPRGPNTEELRRRAAEAVPLLTPEDRQRIRAGRDLAAREREGVVLRDGKWRLPPKGGTHR